MNKILLNTSVSEFLRRIEVTKNKFFVVCDIDGTYCGVVTEGDLRRFIIKNKKLPSKVNEFYNKNGYFEFFDEQNTGKTNLFDATKGFVPLLDRSNKFIGLKPESVEVSPSLVNSVTCFAPVRISFAGGGSDLEHWWVKNRGRVVNLAIDKYARIRVEKNYSDIVNIQSRNLNKELSCRVSSLHENLGHDLNFIIKCLIGIGIEEGYNIEVFCDFDPGSGLGGSSSLVVCLVKAFSILYRLTLTDRQIIELSYQLERLHCKIEGGWQDFIPAVCGGLNVINFKDNGFKNYKLMISKNEGEYLNNCLFISPIGTSRSSSRIHIKQKKEAKTLNYQNKMKKIVEIADSCVDLIGSQNFNKLGSILDDGWQLKKSLGDFISNSSIDDRYCEFMNVGATGGRLLGAGGSGFLLLHVPIKNQTKFLSEAANMNIKLERIKMSNDGVRAIINEN